MRAVALFGKIGHGKTRIVNLICGTHFVSSASASSSTRVMQFGESKQHRMFVIDTPGIGSSEDIAAHVAAQKVALEGIPLSAVFVVVKFGKADEIADFVGHVQDLLSDDNVRVIVTHTDTAQGQVGFSEQAMKAKIASLCGIPASNIGMFGLQSGALLIENFIATSLHEPKRFEISQTQIARITALASGARNISKPVALVEAKIIAATKACQEATSQIKSYETDIAILASQAAVVEMVTKAKDEIFRKAFQELSQDEQHLVYGKAGIALSLKLKTFLETTNSYLSYNVSDPSHPNNNYRACRNCGAVFVKEEGCHQIVCGDVASRQKYSAPKLSAVFKCDDGKNWSLDFLWGSTQVTPTTVRDFLRDKRTLISHTQGFLHTKRPGATFESGCGAANDWNTMPVVDPDRLKELSQIEWHKPGILENTSGALFNARVQEYETHNQELLSNALQKVNLR